MNENNFFNLAIQAQALKFGNFKLKSGRMSPYFFNSGLLNKGKYLYDLTMQYIDLIIKKNIKFDTLFGNAYKGIPLVSSICSIMFKSYKINTNFCYNRKEIKKHGEKKIVVGNIVSSKNIVIIDDVITSGESIEKSIEIIKKESKAKIVHVIVALDRQEIHSNNKLLASKFIQKKYGISVFAIAKMQKLINFINKKNIYYKAIKHYQNIYTNTNI